MKSWKRLPFAIAIALVCLVVAGCDRSDDAEAGAEAEPAATEEDHHHADEDHHHAEGDHHDHGSAQMHAPEGYEPGTYEDWCGGHGVPESMCTRCNPSLVAGFKATGDWCEEHQLPESQCLACNPDSL